MKTWTFIWRDGWGDTETFETESPTFADARAAWEATLPCDSIMPEDMIDVAIISMHCNKKGGQR